MPEMHDEVIKEENAKIPRDSFSTFNCKDNEYVDNDNESKKIIDTSGKFFFESDKIAVFIEIFSVLSKF